MVLPPPHARAAVSLLSLPMILEVGAHKGKIYCCRASYLLCPQCWLALWDTPPVEPGGILPSQAYREEKCSAAYPIEIFFSGAQTCVEPPCSGEGSIPVPPVLQMGMETLPVLNKVRTQDFRM